MASDRNRPAGFWLDANGNLKGWFEDVVDGEDADWAARGGHGWPVYTTDYDTFPGLAEAEETLRREGGRVLVMLKDVLPPTVLVDFYSTNRWQVAGHNWWVLMDRREDGDFVLSGAEADNSDHLELVEALAKVVLLRLDAKGELPHVD